jgi:hypothetical protein
VAGGGRSGNATSVASEILHKHVLGKTVSTTRKRVVRKLLRKVPYLGYAVAGAELVDAVVDRVQKESLNTPASQPAQNTLTSQSAQFGTSQPKRK